MTIWSIMTIIQSIIKTVYIVTVIILIINMSISHLTKERHPLAIYSNNFSLNNRLTPTYTDQRVQQIKKKYDTPTKTSLLEKENHSRDRKYESPLVNKRIEVKQAVTEMHCEEKKAYDSSNNERMKTQTSGEKPNWESILIREEKNYGYNTCEEFYTRPNIKQRLQTHQTQLNFFKVAKESAVITNTIRNRDSWGKLQRRQANDPRIQNIDKINNKIKRILDCINDCQKEELDRSRVSAKITNSILGRSVYSNNDGRQQPNQLQQTNIIQRRRIYNGSFQIDQNLHNEAIVPSLTELRASNASNHFSQFLSSYKSGLKTRQNQVLRRSGASGAINYQRSSSCYDRIKKSVNQEREIEQRSESNLDQIDGEITKFQQKIAELQQQKRKSNIRFKPFYHQSHSIKKGEASRVLHVQTSNFMSNAKEPSSLLESQQKVPTSFVQLQQSPIILKSRNISQAQLTNYQNRKAQDSTPKVKFSAYQSYQDAQGTKCYDNVQLRMKIGQRMQQRKKRIEMFQDDIKNHNKSRHVSNFVKSLSRQVKLDEQLRNSKNWFSECNIKDKYYLLHKSLQSSGIKMSLQQIKQQFTTMNDDQTDPFFSFRQEKYSIQSISHCFINCNKYWKENLLHRWSREQIFIADSINSSFINKNDIEIEDIVRFVNANTDNFYRNRDLYLITCRIREEKGLKEGDKMNMEDFIQVFTKY